jgi:hypothetical protein
MFGVLRARKGHPDVNLRYVVGPTEKYPSKIVPIVRLIFILVNTFRTILLLIQSICLN